MPNYLAKLSENGADTNIRRISIIVVAILQRTVKRHVAR